MRAPRSYEGPVVPTRSSRPSQKHLCDLRRISQQCHIHGLQPSDRRRRWAQRRAVGCGGHTRHMAASFYFESREKWDFCVPDFTSLSESILVVNRGFLIPLPPKMGIPLHFSKGNYCLVEFANIFILNRNVLGPHCKDQDGKRPCPPPPAGHSSIPGTNLASLGPPPWVPRGMRGK